MNIIAKHITMGGRTTRIATIAINMNALVCMAIVTKEMILNISAINLNFEKKREPFSKILYIEWLFIFSLR